MTPEQEQLARFDEGINETAGVEKDIWGRTMVTIDLPGGITLGLRASEIAAKCAPASYERSLAMYRNDCDRRNAGEL